MADDRLSLLATNFPQMIKSVMANKVSEEKRYEQIDLFEQELIGVTERLRDLVQAALSEEKKQTLMSLLEQNGLVVNQAKQIIDANGNLIAHCVSGVKV
jgi:hypothetical protein